MRTTQLEIIVFRRAAGSRNWEFLLLKRIPEKGGFWQPPCGGLEDTDASLLEGAYREVREETGIGKERVLRVIENVHTFVMDKHYLSGEPAPPLTEYVFGFEVATGTPVNLTQNVYVEHEEYRWVGFDEALRLLKWQDNKDAFQKLQKRLQAQSQH